jgi:hypothetical protein
MNYTCYSCGVEKECDHCGHEYFEEGVTYDADDFTLEKQERLVYYGECCQCGSHRIEW